MVVHVDMEKAKMNGALGFALLAANVGCLHRIKFAVTA